MGRAPAQSTRGFRAGRRDYFPHAKGRKGREGTVEIGGSAGDPGPNCVCHARPWRAPNTFGVGLWTAFRMSKSKLRGLIYTHGEHLSNGKTRKTQNNFHGPSGALGRGRFAGTRIGPMPRSSGHNWPHAMDTRAAKDTKIEFFNCDLPKAGANESKKRYAETLPAKHAKHANEAKRWGQKNGWKCNR